MGDRKYEVDYASRAITIRERERWVIGNTRGDYSYASRADDQRKTVTGSKEVMMMHKQGRR